MCVIVYVCAIMYVYHFFLVNVCYSVCVLSVCVLQCMCEIVYVCATMYVYHFLLA